MKQKLLTFLTALAAFAGIGCLTAHADVIDPGPIERVGSNTTILIAVCVVAVIAVAAVILIVVKKTSKKK